MNACWNYIRSSIPPLEISRRRLRSSKPPAMSARPAAAITRLPASSNVCWTLRSIRCSKSASKFAKLGYKSPPMKPCSRSRSVTLLAAAAISSSPPRNASRAVSALLRSKGDEPSVSDLRHTLREVISHCIYGVDINPMSVELCKVGLWI